MPKRQSRRHLHPKINVNQSLHAISNIDKHKCRVNDMVRDSCMTTKKWHQSTVFVWHDCLVCTEMMTLTTLLKLSIRHDGDN